jgi:general secretion pathway protein A
MLYGINERKGFINITGEVGVGKTTLIYTLFNNLNEKVKTAFVYHTTATFEQLLSYILTDLNIAVDTQDKITLLNKLNEYLTQNIPNDETLAIIVDEAQNIPNKVMEEFRLLSNLETTKQKLLQILLVGQPELEEKLNSSDLRQLKQRIGIRRKIKPLSQEESKEYIDHRLKTVGSSSKNIFSSDAISLISKHAGGIPRVINIICDNSLLIGYGLSQKKVTAKTVQEALDDLNESVEGEPTSPAIIPPVVSEERTISRKTLGLFICAVVLFLALILFALTNRDTVKDSSSQENAVKMTQPASEQPATSTVLQAESNEKAPMIESPSEPLPEKPLLTTPPPPVKEIITKISLLEAGGSLYSIALKHYQRANPTIYDLIIRANPEITDIRLIPDEQQIVLPKITSDSFIIKNSDDSYQIYIGTFETRALAADEANKVAVLGTPPNINAQKFSAKDTWYRVTLGPFDSKKEALERVTLLTEEGIIYIP